MVIVPDSKYRNLENYAPEAEKADSAKITQHVLKSVHSNHSSSIVNTPLILF